MDTIFKRTSFIKKDRSESEEERIMEEADKTCDEIERKFYNKEEISDEELDRADECLKKAKIITVEQLAKTTESYLESIDGLPSGLKTLITDKFLKIVLGGHGTYRIRRTTLMVIRKYLGKEKQDDNTEEKSK